MQRPQWINNGKSSHNSSEGKVKNKVGVILEAQRDKKESALCYVYGDMSPQNAELEHQLQKYKCRVVLQGNIGDSGAHAVFTEQGSSASQMSWARGPTVNAMTHAAILDLQLTSGAISGGRFSTSVDSSQRTPEGRCGAASAASCAYVVVFFEDGHCHLHSSFTIRHFRCTCF